MKRIAFTLGLLFAMQTVIFAQMTDIENITLNAHLLKTFNLNVLTGATQDFTFATSANYNVGVIEGAGVSPGTSNITVEATGNWNLKIKAPDFAGYNGPNGLGTGTITINNVGVWVTATGGHQFGTQISCPFTSLATAMGLANADQILIDLIPTGGGNSGDGSDNAFTLHWQMGQGIACPNMRQESMFDQLSLGLFSLGDFTSTAVLTLTELP